MNNRSMGFDTECNVMIDQQRDVVSACQDRLIAEHLDVSEQTLADAFTEHDTMIGVIEALNKSSGRGLRLLGDRDSNLRSGILADSQIMDQRYHPGQETSTGSGVRPRHVGVAAGVVLLGYLGWAAYRRR